MGQYITLGEVYIDGRETKDESRNLSLVKCRMVALTRDVLVSEYKVFRLLDYINNIFPNMREIHRAWIFGSCLKNTCGPYSKLCLLLELENEVCFRLSYLYGNYPQTIGDEIYICEVGEAMHLSGKVGGIIKKEAKLVYVRSE